MRDSLATYEANGFFDLIAEFIVYINARTPEIDAELAPYQEKYGPTKFRVMGDKNNYGILRAMNWMVGNATKPYFLFLERDFQLIEPATCVHEQLSGGYYLIEEGKADVVRYRSRRVSEPWGRAAEGSVLRFTPPAAPAPCRPCRRAAGPTGPSACSRARRTPHSPPTRGSPTWRATTSTGYGTWRSGGPTSSGSAMHRRAPSSSAATATGATGEQRARVVHR